MCPFDGNPLLAQIGRQWRLVEGFKAVVGDLQGQVSITNLVGDERCLLESSRPDQQNIFGSQMDFDPSFLNREQIARAQPCACRQGEGDLFACSGLELLTALLSRVPGEEDTVYDWAITWRCRFDHMIDDLHDFSAREILPLAASKARLQWLACRVFHVP